jgi:hypothetical protein
LEPGPVGLERQELAAWSVVLAPAHVQSRSSRARSQDETQNAHKSDCGHLLGSKIRFRNASFLPRMCHVVRPIVGCAPRVVAYYVLTVTAVLAVSVLPDCSMLTSAGGHDPAWIASSATRLRPAALAA